MTLEIKLSQIKNADDFAAAVAAYIKAKKDHQKTIGEPAPTAAALVEAAVRVVHFPIEAGRADDYVADYNVEDDTPPPPPPPTLDERRAKLAMEAQAAYEAALEVVFPKLKRRLFQLRATAARSIDPAKRAPTDSAIVAAADAIDAKAVALHLHLAEVEDAISDLTEETIGAYKVPPFGG